MCNMTDSIEIVWDVLDVARRLKEIDPEYELHYDRRTGKFLLKDSRGSVQLVYRYPSIDVRMLTDARRTRAERIDKILKEIDAANERAERSYLRAEENRIEDGLSDAAERYYSGCRGGTR